eukprot:6380038-Amphidinium_carterae.1
MHQLNNQFGGLRYGAVAQRVPHSTVLHLVFDQCWDAHSPGSLRRVCFSRYDMLTNPLDKLLMKPTGTVLKKSELETVMLTSHICVGGAPGGHGRHIGYYRCRGH